MSTEGSTILHMVVLGIQVDYAASLIPCGQVLFVYLCRSPRYIPARDRDGVWMARSFFMPPFRPTWALCWNGNCSFGLLQWFWTSLVDGMWGSHLMVSRQLLVHRISFFKITLCECCWHLVLVGKCFLQPLTGYDYFLYDYDCLQRTPWIIDPGASIHV